ncbi:MAG: glycosyltransferase family 4 protein [Bacteroidetes bacterium]|nr:glycosyltransferase family 4 protein [Bacteroidota bacterium]
MAKKKILVAIDWYLPGYKAGGPIRSCANIISNLKNDFDFSVVTSDTDFSDNTPYPTVKSDQWNTLPDGTRVYYFSSTVFSYKAMEKLIDDENPDIVYMNSFFSQQFTLTPLRVIRKKQLKCKAIIAPRGMLGAGALAIKPMKKLAFISFSKMMGTYDKVRWHASTPQEADEIKAIFGKRAEVVVALNLSSAQTASIADKQKKAKELNLLFFSRISRKKNLHLVLQWLQQINADTKINFNIYGTLEDESYWNECKSLIEKLPAHVRAAYKGVVSTEQAQQVFAENHFSILPTMHENYGHAIIESLAAGVPVIVSKNTPWHQLEEACAGFDIELADDEKFKEAILAAASMDNATFNQWQRASSQFAASVLNNQNTITQNKKLFAG